MAFEFQSKSVPKFPNCLAAMDGMLIWLEKPTDASCAAAGVGARRFFCGRKHKFGLNLQGCCDSNRRFLDIQLRHPGSTSDFLSFSTSNLYHKLEVPSFLAEGLCIFGDAAYVNNRYFATPFKSVSSGPKDDYNFYHSQLRISIECAFGMLVNRWGILRRALPCAMGLRKSTSLVICLCRMHNYCIDCRLESKQSPMVPAPLASDNLEITGNGGIPMLRVEDRDRMNDCSPEEFLNGGMHHEDTSDNQRRQFARRGRTASSALPREILLSMVADGGFKHPTPKNWV